MAQNLVSQFIEQAAQETRIGRFDAALEAVNRALALDPNSSEALGLKAIACSMLGRAEEAESNFKAALRITPDNPKIAYNYALFLQEADRKQEALEAAKRAAALNPANTSAVDLLRGLEGELGSAPFDLPSPFITSDEGEIDTEGSVAGPSAARTSPYIRPGFYGEGMNIQSLKSIESLGELWYAGGWLLVVLGALAFVPVTFNAIKGLMTNALHPTFSRPIPAGFQMPIFAQGLVMLGLVVWMLLEMINRRGNWLWFLTVLLASFLGCFYLNLSWLVLLLYLIFDRPKIEKAN